MYSEIHDIVKYQTGGKIIFILPVGYRKLSGNCILDLVHVDKGCVLDAERGWLSLVLVFVKKRKIAYKLVV